MEETLSLKRISQITGFSKTTVSAALLGRGDVAESTRERIVGVADELGYRPQAAGRALVTGRRETIGFLSERGYLAGRDWTIGVLGGLVDALEGRGYHTMVFHAEPGDTDVPPLLLRRAIDGMVLSVFWRDRFLENLAHCGIPAVAAVPRGSVPCDSVGPDDAGVAALATRHLVELGHRRIAYVGTFWPAAGNVNRLRHRAYVQTMRTAGLSPIQGGQRIAATAELIAQALGHHPTAFVCFSDVISAEVVRELAARGLSVPRDLSVIGIDDRSFTDIFVPRLTTVCIPYTQIGARAAQLMLDRIENPQMERRHIKLGGELIARESTAAPSVEDAPGGSIA